MRRPLLTAALIVSVLCTMSAASAQSPDCDAVPLAEAGQRMLEFAEAGSAGAYVLPNGYVLRVGADSTFCSRPIEGGWSLSKFDQQGIVVVTRRDFADRTDKRVFADRIDRENKYILGKYLVMFEVGNTLYLVSTTQNMGS
jgi:hypothetical protein